MAGEQRDDKKRQARKGADRARQTSQKELLQEMDRLAQRVAQATDRLAHLHAERASLRGELARLTTEQKQFLRVAGVADAAALTQRMSRIGELEKANRAMEQERGETARRLRVVIEKVDLLQEES